MIAERKLLDRIVDSQIRKLGETRERHDFGPVSAFFDPHESSPWLNFAVTQGEGEVDLNALADAFHEKGRIPRFEFFEELAPDLAVLLERDGYVREMTAPAMVLVPGGLPEGAANLARSPRSAAECLAWRQAANEAFESDLGADEATAKRDFEAIQRGDAFAAVVFDYDLAVSGGWLIGDSQIAELAGIGTRPAYRRRGFASMVSRRLCEDFFRRGGELVWLSAGDAAAEAVYSRLGFRRVGLQLNYSKQS